jgi:hypothetical protein
LNVGEKYKKPVADYFFDKVAEIEIIPKVIAESAKVRLKIAAPAAGFESRDLRPPGSCRGFAP